MMCDGTRISFHNVFFLICVNFTPTHDFGRWLVWYAKAIHCNLISCACRRLPLATAEWKNNVISVTTPSVAPLISAQIRPLSVRHLASAAIKRTHCSTHHQLKGSNPKWTMSGRAASFNAHSISQSVFVGAASWANARGALRRENISRQKGDNAKCRVRDQVQQRAPNIAFLHQLEQK